MEKRCETCTCIVCKETLSNIDETGNQPDEGLEFTSYGHYGSTVFDPADGTALVVNICDRCLTEARGVGAVLFINAPPPPVKPHYEIWGEHQDKEAG